MLTDLTEDQLHEYRSAQREPADFDAFWDGTLAESRSVHAGRAAVVLERVDHPFITDFSVILSYSIRELVVGGS